MGFNWTPENTDRLRDLAAKGISARLIAIEIGAPSRNAVIGKAARKGIRLECPDRRPKGSKNNPVFGRRTHRVPGNSPKRVIPGAPEPISRDLSVLELRKRDCRFPVTDDAPFFFCGAPQADGSSYCAHHFHICTVRR